MQILLLQLSDFHIGSDADVVGIRLKKVVEAIRYRSFSVEVIVVILAGDIGATGSSDEYLLAESVFDPFLKSLGDGMDHPPRVEIVVVPGNHDCNFRGSGLARKTVIDRLLKEKEPQIDESIITLCTQVQDEFFAFRDRIAKPSITHLPRMVDEYRFSAGDNSLSLLCANSAWLSTIKEDPGHLLFPPSALPIEPTGSSAVVVIFHHPYPWLKPSNRHEFQSRVEDVADLVLTGHEHIHIQRTENSVTGAGAEYLAAVAFQNPQDLESAGFNAILLDLELKKQQTFQFEWDSDVGMFRPVTAEPPWEAFQLNPIRARKEFRFNAETRAWLDDLGIAIPHPSGRSVECSDVFTYPDLRLVPQKKGQSATVIKGDSVPARISGLSGVIITGPEKSGKTSLAKQLCTVFHAQGYVPVFIDGTRFRANRPDRVEKAIDSAFSAQYSEELLERYKQLDAGHRVVVIDDFDDSQSGSSSEFAATMQFIRSFAGRVILLADDLDHEIQETLDTTRAIHAEAKLDRYNIQPFGHARRDEIIERFFLMDPELAENDRALAERVLTAQKTLDVIFGENFVPAYPVFILPILQAFRDRTKVELHASTYGYFYELLIRASVASNTTKEGYDTKMSYLAFLAYSMFERNVTTLSDAEIRAIHDAFLERHALEVHWTEMKDELIKANILAQMEDSYAFKYPYIYYYFVALYLARNLRKRPEVLTRISDLARGVYLDDPANILLFLAHLSNDPFVIDELLREASSVFADVEPARLEEDVAFLSDVAREPPVYVDRNARAERKTMFARMDDADQAFKGDSAAQAEDENQQSEKKDDTDAEGDVSQFALQLERAFKTIEILGQMLKNFPGLLEAGEKEKIARACYTLGLRALTTLTQTLAAHKDSILEGLSAALRQMRPSDTPDEIEKRAVEAVSRLGLAVSFGTVKRISVAVGSRDLNPTFETLRLADKTASVSLIDVSVRLDQFGNFPSAVVLEVNQRLKDSPFAKTLLQFLVVLHFTLFPVPMKVRQAICQKLGIPFTRSVRMDPDLKLLKSGD